MKHTHIDSLLSSTNYHTKMQSKLQKFEKWESKSQGWGAIRKQHKIPC